MKKLSILVALILCVTIGGVYANWLYPGNTTNEVTQPINHIMAETTLDGAYGSYHTQTNTLKITVDQANPQFEAKLVYDGELVVTFTPHTNISDAQLDAALNAVVTISISDGTNAVYNETEIWKLTNSTINLTEDDWTLDAGVYTYTLDCSELSDIITLGGTFALPTVDDYKAFQDVQKLAVFRINLTSGTVVVTP